MLKALQPKMSGIDSKDNGDNRDTLPEDLMHEPDSLPRDVLINPELLRFIAYSWTKLLEKPIERLTHTSHDPEYRVDKKE